MAAGRVISEGTVDASSPPLTRRRGFWSRHRRGTLTVGLVLYTAALAVAVADEVLRLGLFATPLEREARSLIRQFDDPSAATRREAADQFVSRVDTFLAVPELLRVLDSPSQRTREVAAGCLRRICGTRQDYDPAAPLPERQAAIARWRRWWAEHESRY